MWGYQIVRSYPHDAEAFTQGLEWADGFLYEGTGLNDRSSIRKVKLDTGDVVQRRAVGAEHFGEIALREPDGKPSCFHKLIDLPVGRVACH